MCGTIVIDRSDLPQWALVLGDTPSIASHCESPYPFPPVSSRLTCLVYNPKTII
jgi:hypothetical protein